jgi:hypothetical protein
MCLGAVEAKTSLTLTWGLVPLRSVRGVRKRIIKSRPSWPKVKLRKDVSSEYDRILAGPVWVVSLLAAHTSSVKPVPVMRSAASRAGGDCERMIPGVANSTPDPSSHLAPLHAIGDSKLKGANSAAARKHT